MMKHSYKRLKCFTTQDTKDLELDIIPASLTDDQAVKLRDPNHEVNEEKRKSARKKEWVPESLKPI